MILKFLFMVDLKKTGERILTKFIEILPPNLHNFKNVFFVFIGLCD